MLICGNYLRTFLSDGLYFLCGVASESGSEGSIKRCKEHAGRAFAVMTVEPRRVSTPQKQSNGKGSAEDKADLGDLECIVVLRCLIGRRPSSEIGGPGAGMEKTGSWNFPGAVMTG